MIIDGVEVKKGSYQLIRMEVSKLPSGTPIDIHTHVFRSENDGPVVLILGGLHGDEINGVEIVRRALHKKIFNDLKAGTVIAIPLLNVYGFINFSRELPDGKDINRSFPGVKSGSLASRVARKLTKEILPHIDLGVDFHTGGKSIYNEPQIRFAPSDERAMELAKIFGTPFIIESALINQSLRKEAFKKNKSLLVFEGGESLRLDEKSIKVGIKGIQNILTYLKMKDGELNVGSFTHLSDTIWLRASMSGIFISKVSSGDRVEVGQLLGEIHTPHNQYAKKIKCKKAGYIYGINNTPVVNQGDALFHIGI